MKKLLNTLFITTQGAYLNKDGLAVVVNIDHKEALRLPIHNLGGIVCFGQVSCSPFLMQFCAENDVLISFLSEQGQFLARVHGPVSGNVLLRKDQYRKSDQPEISAAIARSIVIGKIANSRTVLQRFQRDHGDDADIATWAKGRLPRVGRGLKPGQGGRIGVRLVSPPTRGAWIETVRQVIDRHAGESPPTRGAWIETSNCRRNRSWSGVASHAGGVD